MATSPAPIPAVDLVYSVPIGAVIAWSPPGKPDLPPGFALCDGNVVIDPDSLFNNRPTPDLRGRFILGAGPNDEIGNQGGDPSFTIGGYESPALFTSPTQSSEVDAVFNNVIQADNPTSQQWRYVLTGNDGKNDGNHHHWLEPGSIAVPPPAWTALLYIIRIK